ncbi:MAG: hypothetical protein JWM81_977 [Candidatus Saccharibacteria bacterium]|nr:hypothetical protein [Candidatus Saccharibacteria bacterium]
MAHLHMQHHPNNKQTPASRFQLYQSGKFSLLLSILILVGWFLVLGVVFTGRQQISDWIALRNYQPPATIAALATQDTMTDKSRNIFYVNKPAITQKSDFNASCPSSSREQTIVLGCYRSNQAGIYLLNVDDARLNGVVQVTAAHEMLHAAYDRLSGSERQRVDAMLMDFYKTVTDQRIRQTIDGYRVSEPNDVVNEMHSIFGTEITDLPPGLEAYYSQYFTNRKQIAQFADQYEQEFSSRKTQVEEDDKQLTGLKKQISDTEANLKQQQTDITTSRQHLESLQASGDIASYNAGVPGYNKQVSDYNAGVQSVQRLVDQYNTLVVARNAVASEITALTDALSSSVAPIQK